MTATTIRTIHRTTKPATRPTRREACERLRRQKADLAFEAGIRRFLEVSRNA